MKKTIILPLVASALISACSVFKHWRVLHSGEDASFLSSMDAGGFTGASVGIATVK